MAHDTSAAAAPSDTGQVSAKVAQPSTPSPSDNTSVSKADTSSTEVATADTTKPAAAPGDSAQAGERIEPTEAQQGNGGVANDSATGVAAEPMARDTSTVLAQADTNTQETQPAQEAEVDSSQAQADTAALSVSADTTTGQATDTMATDTTALHAQADTTAEPPSEVAMENQPDTTTVVGDTSSVDKPGPRAKADTISSKGDSLARYHGADRIRPPEDSTELHGQVNANKEKVEADQAAVGAAAVEPTGNLATGADAVALMTRGGEACRAKDPETSHEVQWDLAASPVTLNPCGTGTMTLPKIQTGEK